MLSESLKGLSASESGSSGTTLIFFSTTGMVSLVTVHSEVTRLFFLFSFASVLGGVTVTAEEGPAAVAPWGGPPPFEALTNFLHMQDESPQRLACGESLMTRPLLGWLLRAGPWQDGYACSEVGPGWLPSHTKCIVAIGPVVGRDS